MSEKVVYQGGPYPVPTERYIVRYWHEDDRYYTTHANGWNNMTEALANARAFQNAGWFVKVVDMRAEED